jgi:hypothetical protein
MVKLRVTRSAILGVVAIYALLYFGLLIWTSTCTVSGCGSVHSSVWLRIGLLAIPFALFTYSAWRMTQTPASSATTLVTSLPWMIVGTAISGWALGFSPTDTGGGTGNGFAGVAESAAPPWASIVSSSLFLVGWVVVLWIIGFARLRGALRLSLRSHWRKLFTVGAWAGALLFAGAVTITTFSGSGVDIDAHSSLNYSSDASATPKFVQIQGCRDDRLVRCTLVAKDVVEGDSFDLRPGIYTIRSNPPKGYACSSTDPAVMYLFPFELLHVQYINVNCAKATQTPSPSPSASPSPGGTSPTPSPSGG